MDHAMMMDPVSTIRSADVLDSRDLDEVLDDLENRQTTAEENPDWEGAEPLDADEGEVSLLEDLQYARDNMPDWSFGETLVAEDYFLKYAQELADDVGAVDSEAGWPNTFIDWDAAAEALKQDYTEYEILGCTFYARA